MSFPVLRTFRFILLLGLFLPGVACAGLFGYQESVRSDLSIFPQWLSVLERHLREKVPKGNCKEARFNTCHLEHWYDFLRSIRSLSAIEQIRRVNEYANNRKYILDIVNYGVEDYWATPGEFLFNNGDCEDYAITKLLSLKWLGFDVSGMSVVVLQDTNLRIPHAVLAVNYKSDVLIMDNQIEEVISHRHILHYVPIYSVNEQNWRMFVPN